MKRKERPYLSRYSWRGGTRPSEVGERTALALLFPDSRDVSRVALRFVVHKLGAALTELVGRLGVQSAAMDRTFTTLEGLAGS